jgi:two-component system sensor histidine kinase DesK
MSVARRLHPAEWSGFGALLIFLLFLYFPIAELLDSDAGAEHRALVLAAVAAFLALYLSLMLRPAEPLRRRSEWLRLAALVVLALAISLDDSAQWASLFIYVAAVAGFRLPFARALPAILLCATLTVTVGAVADYEAGDVIALTIYVLAIGIMLLSFASLIHANAELRAARAQIARLAVADERLRFARDLHDLLGHSLSVIALKSELAGRLLGRDPERAAAEVAEIERVTREALVEVREAVTGYRRMTLADELAGARIALSAAGIEATVEREKVTLPPESESVLAWAVREGATNVIRHSGARRCAIRVSAGLADVAVEVVDDGAGSAVNGGGSGLAGLAERARQHGGRVEAAPGSAGGFRLRVSVPAA